MPRIPFFATLLLLSLSLIITPSAAEIKTLKITADNRRLILFQKFGFTHNGHISVAVSVASNLSSLDPSRLGFFLLSKDYLTQVVLQLQHDPNLCLLDSVYINPLFTFCSLSPPPHPSLNQSSFAITSPNEYSLFFANCASAPESHVTMDVRTELYNLDADGVKDYLSAGLTQLPSMFSIFSLIFFGFLGFWIYILLRSQNKLFIHRIHRLMAALLLMKALNLISAAGNKHYVKITGMPHGCEVLFYVSKFVGDMLLVTVIVLIGAGWPFLKPILEGKEKGVLMIVIPLEVLANVASIVIGQTGPFMEQWVTWNLVFLLVDIVCCCAIIFPIVVSIRRLKVTSKTDGKTDGKRLGKLMIFRQFYRLVIGYLFFTRIVVFLLRANVEYKYTWVSNAAEEIANLVFYMVMFYMFRPHDEDEEEEAGMKSLGFEVEALMAEI